MRTITFFILFSLTFLLGKDVYAQLEKTDLQIIDGISDAGVKAKIELNTSALLTAFGKAVIDGTMPKLTQMDISSEAVNTLNTIWETSAMACPVSVIRERCLTRPQGGYQVRNIPITMFSAPKADQEQDLVINFTSTGRIDAINIAIAENQYTQILHQNISVQDFVRRQRIIDLVEQFRTAYNEKDMPFMQHIFSDNALIITGKVIREKPNSSEMMNRLNTEKIVYFQQTKAQYLTKLKTVFQANKYINVVFDDIEVMAHPKYPEVYGVTLKQTWNSSSYNDEGFLFLLVDFRNEDEPLVHIRTWQPNMYNGRELTREERFNLGSIPPLTR